MDNVQRENSCSFSHDRPATVAVVRDQKDDRLLPPIRRQNRLTVKKATKRKILTREVRFCVGSKIEKKKKKTVVQVLASFRVSQLQV